MMEIETMMATVTTALYGPIRLEYLLVNKKRLANNDQSGARQLQKEGESSCLARYISFVCLRHRLLGNDVERERRHGEVHESDEQVRILLLELKDGLDGTPLQIPLLTVQPAPLPKEDSI